MQLVERHVIARRDPRYALIDEAAFKSKNLYNATLYELRQAFIHRGVYLSYEYMDKCGLTEFFAESVGICVSGSTWRSYVSATQREHSPGFSSAHR